VSQALFISDLHLSGERPDTSQQFFRFLRDEGSRAEALYVLGDLFESWAGDDELQDAAGDPLAAEVARAFRQLADTGVKVRVMHTDEEIVMARSVADILKGARV